MAKQNQKGAANVVWISNRELRDAYISIDNQLRLYVSVGARELLKLPDDQKFELIVGYDSVNKRIIVAKPDVVRIPNVKPFKFSKRATSKAERIAEQTGLKDQLPVRFSYVGRDYAEVAGAYAFQLLGHEAADK